MQPARRKSHDIKKKITPLLGSEDLGANKVFFIIVVNK